MNFLIRQATTDDVSQIVELMEEAKAYLRSQGIDQWQQGPYPDGVEVREDLATETAYVVCDQLTVEPQVPIGYANISFDGDSAYDDEGARWEGPNEYAVIHRLIVANKYKGQGLAARLFDYAETLCQQQNISTIRVDTALDNLGMQRLLRRLGYIHRGEINQLGGRRLAYEKILTQ